MTARYRAADLQTLCTDILAAAGVDRSDAGSVADNLVGANLRGVDSHGVIRMTSYVGWFTQRQIAAKTNPVFNSQKRQNMQRLSKERRT